jgi:hypothetical protein
MVFICPADHFALLREEGVHMSGQFEIPPPERLEPRPEFPPITNPPLVDQEPVD